jgi:FixJ family two-component response regulator
MQHQPTVFLVDDDAGVRNGLRAAMESSGLKVETFESADEFAGEYTGKEFGCLLLDLRMDGMSGVQLLEKLRQHAAHVFPVIMITGHGDVPLAVECMQLGATDFLQKPLDHQLLLSKITIALERSRIGHQKHSETTDAQIRLARLTPREWEMLHFLIAGKSSKKIASESGLSIRTVNNHRTHILGKSGAQNTAELVRLAMLAGKTAA